MQFVRGVKDEVKREVMPIKSPVIPKKKFGVEDLIPGYEVCSVNISDGKWKTQLIRISRIEHEKAA